MLVALRQHQRRSAFPHGLNDFVADQPIARFVGDQLLIEFVELDSSASGSAGRTDERPSDGPAPCAQTDERPPAAFVHRRDDARDRTA